MKQQKTIAAIMILISSVMTAVTTAWASLDIAYPAILCMLGLLGLQRRFTWDIKPERRAITSVLMLLLALLFALHYRYGGPGGWVAHEQIMSLAWQTVARYFLAAMILMLFLGSPQRLPPSLGLFHVANAICAGQVLLLNDQFIAFRLLELVSVVLVVLYAATTHEAMTLRLPTPVRRRRSSWLASALILVVAANGGWIVSSVLYRHVEVLDYIPMWFAKQGVGLERLVNAPGEVAFSTSGQLSSIGKIIRDQDPTAALTIRSTTAPGYLRARAFDVYDRSEWRNSSPRERMVGRRSTRPFTEGVTIFQLYEGPVTNLKKMTIRHEARFDGDAMFTTSGAFTVKTLLKTLQRDDHDIVYAHNLRRGTRYRIDYREEAYRKAPTDRQRERMLEVPLPAPGTDRRLAELAKKIFAARDTTVEKIEAAVDYFGARYDYSLELEIPPGRDRLTYFLFEQPAESEKPVGYCEYFASGTAILLRQAGVPTRYVTGFMVTQRDPQTGFWLARNMDAHAWVEAWDQERGQWSIVEATVQQNQAASGVAEQLGRLGGGMSVALSQFFQAVYDYGLLGVASWLFTSYGLLTTTVLFVIISGAMLWRVLSRRFRRRKTAGHRRSRVVHDPALAALHKMLARMDRKLGAAGARRHLSETLHAFAKRLRTRDSGDEVWSRVSDWYLDYAALRYCRRVGAERLEQLQQRAHRLRDSL